MLSPQDIDESYRTLERAFMMDPDAVRSMEVHLVREDRVVSMRVSSDGVEQSEYPSALADTNMLMARVELGIDRLEFSNQLRQRGFEDWVIHVAYVADPVEARS